MASGRSTFQIWTVVYHTSTHGGVLFHMTQMYYIWKSSLWLTHIQQRNWFFLMNGEKLVRIIHVLESMHVRWRHVDADWQQQTDSIRWYFVAIHWINCMKLVGLFSIIHSVKWVYLEFVCYLNRNAVLVKKRSLVNGNALFYIHSQTYIISFNHLFRKIFLCSLLLTLCQTDWIIF